MAVKHIGTSQSRECEIKLTSQILIHLMISEAMESHVLHRCMGRRNESYSFRENKQFYLQL